MDERERHVEAAVDRVIREMTALDPRPGLRQRVLREIEGRTAGRFTVPRLASAAALAIAAMLVVWLAKPLPDPVSEQTVAYVPAPAGSVDRTAPASVAAAAPGPAGASDARVAGAVPPLRTPGARRRVQAEESVVLAAFTVPGGGVEIEPLPAIQPITIVPVRPVAIPATTEIVIPPIDLDPLDIGPLSPPR